MKVIDLLIAIANGIEVPNKIKWEDTIYAYSDYDKDYLEFPFSEEEYRGLFNMKDSILTQFLNDEVEIIEDTPKEDKKIEKLDVVLLGQCDNWLQPTIDTDEKIRAELNPYIIDVVRENTLVMQRKINEIIDKMNGE